ncbi:MAG TPA: peptidase M61 [Caulobacteraceae bacterium]|nr:peptidase M61 [Caulobacteraceae bacterium]
MKSTAGAAVLLLLAVAPARAVTPPQPAPTAPSIAAPQDVPYPGMIRLAVDASDLDHAAFRVHETIPVETGPSGADDFVLLYPKWLPGNHSPSGPIDKLAGLTLSANGHPLTWRRDPVDVYAFHVQIPAGVAAIDADFDFLSPVSTNEGRIMMTHQLVSLQWNTVALYPAGYFSRDIQVQATVRLPPGFSLATALDTQSVAAETTTFKPTSFNTLVDSPLIAGLHARRIDLDPGAPARVTLDVMADHADELAATPSQIDDHRNLVRQAYRLFGSHHYDHYDFLLTLSDRLGGIGLEHHQSSEDGTSPKYFTDYAATVADRDLLAHEFTHSWNGKFRRPADLWTPNFNTPMRDSLLWVYEGQTQYWGYVLAARSGLMTREEALDAIALTAATYDRRIGRSWRPLEDTTNDPIIAQRRPLPWLSFQRSEDYYSEGELVWLDADTLIRQLSAGRRSLDDFATRFFGVENGSYVTDTYTLGDVAAALNAVQPYDWAGFLRQRLEGRGPGAPLDGLARGGYRLVFAPTPTGYFHANETLRRIINLEFSLGLTIGAGDADSGSLLDVQWDGPAFRAGLAVGMKILAVDGETYSAERLRDAVKGQKPVDLVVQQNGEVRSVRIDYADGPRYPRLERIGAGRSSLDDILSARP